MDEKEYYRQASEASMAFAASCAQEELEDLGKKATEAHNTLAELSMILEVKIKEAQALAEEIKNFKEN